MVEREGTRDINVILRTVRDKEVKAPFDYNRRTDCNVSLRFQTNQILSTKQERIKARSVGIIKVR